jgi:hypothetical protein
LESWLINCLMEESLFSHQFRRNLIKFPRKKPRRRAGLSFFFPQKLYVP